MQQTLGARHTSVRLSLTSICVQLTGLPGAWPAWRALLQRCGKSGADEESIDCHLRECHLAGRAKCGRANTAKKSGQLFRTSTQRGLARRPKPRADGEREEEGAEEGAFELNS